MLADEGIFGKSDCILGDGLVAGAAICNFENCSPFGESAAQLIELSCHSWQSFNSFGEVLFFSVSNDSKSFINFDSWDNSFALEVFDELDSLSCGLFGSFFLQDDS